jgi:hypothetical protein
MKNLPQGLRRFEAVPFRNRQPPRTDLLRRAPEQVEENVAILDKEAGPTAYLVRCRHCGQHLAYADSPRRTPAT